MKSILQNWVAELGLRHQGVLLAAVRGCDTAPKEAASKTLARYFRGVILNPHCGDLSKSQSFMEICDNNMEFGRQVKAFMAEKDALPTHYVLHLVHAAEIVGYYHPHAFTANMWSAFYARLCRKFHMRVETKDELDARLNADEDSFGNEQRNP